MPTSVTLDGVRTTTETAVVPGVRGTVRDIVIRVGVGTFRVVPVTFVVVVVVVGRDSRSGNGGIRVRSGASIVSTRRGVGVTRMDSTDGQH